MTADMSSKLNERSVNVSITPSSLAGHESPREPHSDYESEEEENTPLPLGHKVGNRITGNNNLI